MLFKISIHVGWKMLKGKKYTLVRVSSRAHALVIICMLVLLLDMCFLLDMAIGRESFPYQNVSFGQEK